MTEVEILPAIPGGSKMIFPGDHTPMQICVLQDANTSKVDKKNLDNI